MKLLIFPFLSYNSCTQSFFFFYLDGSSGDGKESTLLHLGKPDDVEVSIELKNWLFALEGAQEMAESWWFSDSELLGREERCWHTTFQNVRVKAKSSPKNLMNGNSQRIKKYPVELVTVSVFSCMVNTCLNKIFNTTLLFRSLLIGKFVD